MLSIVIPYFSGLKDLKECIASIQSQSDAQIIVVNDSSKILTLNPKVKIIDNKTTLGAAYSRNKGFLATKNDFILFADHDLVFQANAIKNLLEKSKSADIIFPKVIYENGKVMHPIGKEKSQPQISACFLIKKSAATKLDELFDENYKIYSEDSDFFLRCHLFNLKFKYVPKAILIHKLKYSYNNQRFYLENKNLLYGWAKFLFIKKKGFIHPFKLSSWLSNFVCAIFNFDKFDWSHYDRSKKSFAKLKLLFRKHRKLSDKGSFFLLFQMFKAKISFLAVLPKALSKNLSLRKKINLKL